jgi:hypothetical protein
MRLRCSRPVHRPPPGSATVHHLRGELAHEWRTAPLTHEARRRRDDAEDRRLPAHDPVDRDCADGRVSVPVGREAAEDPVRDLGLEELSRSRCAAPVRSCNRVEQHFGRLRRRSTPRPASGSPPRTRRLELVPAQLARLAPQARARAAGTARARTRTRTPVRVTYPDRWTLGSASLHRHPAFRPRRPCSLPGSGALTSGRFVWSYVAFAAALNSA